MATRPPLVGTSSAKVQPNNQPSPGSIGNTTGIILPQTAPNPSGNPKPPIKPTEKEKGWWDRWGSAVTHGVLDVAGFVPVLGAIPDLINAGVYAAEGDYVQAGISAVAAIPFGGDAVAAGNIAVKGGKQVAKQLEEAAAKKLAKELEEAAAKKAAKEAEEAAAKKAAKEAEEAAAKKKKGGKDKGKKKLDCGQFGSYGELLKSTGDNMFDRDHVPSKAALKHAARDLAAKLGKKLSPEQLKKLDGMIERDAAAIAIPKDDHKAGRTHGHKNSPDQIREDAKDLQGAAKKDTEEIKKKGKKMDPKCRKLYADWAAEVVKKTNDDYKKWLLDQIKSSMK